MNSGIIFSLFLSFSLCISKFSTETAPEYLYHSCPNASLFASDSTYRSKLHTLVSSLSSAAAHSVDGFASATTGRNPPHRAYGFFLCCGDLDNATCSRCVAIGKRGILERCTHQLVSASWFDQCMPRYSNLAIFSAVEPSPNRVLHNNWSVDDPTRFMRLLGETLNYVAARASAGGPGKKVAAAEANFTSSQKLHALVQCTPYLTASDCFRCLRFGIANLSQGKEGGTFVAPSCNLRYELYPFYNASALPSPPYPAPAPTLPARVTGTKGLSDIPTPNESSPFAFDAIRAATKNFSLKKLGRGGFGEVFKGELDGQLIAVKRLFQGSTKGDEEFKNEVALLEKLQHRNLVRLLGSCLEGEERLLVFEFAENGSLDQILFNPERRSQLTWPTRYQIACGIARGMRYLHEKPQPWIIHRDLKPSNILLDREMIPKISDFGLARIFGDDKSWQITHKLAGTPGYMAPEYFWFGIFSSKSDVYSFGVLLLQLVSGKKIPSSDGVNLISDARRKLRAGSPLALLDATVGNHSVAEVVRCVEIGVQCTQRYPESRPTMEEIVNLLDQPPQ